MIISHIAGAVLAASLVATPQVEVAEVLPGRYIVQLEGAPVSIAAPVLKSTEAWIGNGRERRLNLASQTVRSYQSQLRDRRSQVLAAVETQLVRKLRVHHEFEIASNGFSVSADAAQLAALRAAPGVLAVYPVTVHRPQTDAGPGWIQAPQAWAASGAMGEGVVVGVIDSGINWDHPAFADVGGDGFNHSNPRNQRFGLCSNAAVGCNDKLIGVHDFTDEGNRLGRDIDGHGTHVASTAVGNLRTSNVLGNTATLAVDVSGVAPHANVISYKVCTADDPGTTEDENTCFLDAILDAYDQVVIDRVDIVNYSIGGTASDPWRDTDSLAMLAARAAGILLVTSAGNGGADAGTLTSPANAPWMLAVANITHNRRFENVLESLTGGSATPPPDLVGVGFTAAFGPAPIVHAADFGNALCGTGTPELQSRCDDHTGASNPFAPGTFDGQIVVCDRGTYGRVEKGFNLRAAGAGGYILANTPAQGESIVSDDHCLPAVHLGSNDGNPLRSWLAAGGSGQTGQISGQSQLLNDAFGDHVSSSSSRGPDAVVPGLLKPEVGAPGSNILAAGVTGASSDFKSGTSMASPHVAGAAAVLLSAQPTLGPAQLHSMLMSTAFNDAMIDDANGNLADGFATGAGRINVEQATRAGLHLNITRAQFLAANPGVGGDPSTLNLPGLVNASCLQSCEFTRRVTALGGGSWTAAISSRDGLGGTVTPASFELAAGETQTLQIVVDSSNPALLNRWAYGYVDLVPTGGDLADQRLTLQIRSDSGSLPGLVQIETAHNTGSQLITLNGLAALPSARFATLGLALAQEESRNLPEDPTEEDPYDNLAVDGGVFFQNISVANSGSALLVRTVPANNGDLDLFVGRDTNGNLQPDANEELCRSTSSTADESCLLDDAPAGTYWMLLQNWRAFAPASLDGSRLRFAVAGPDDQGLVATGPGSAPAVTALQTRLIWDRGDMRSGSVWMGALLPQAQAGAGLGAIPVELSRISDGNSGSATVPDLGAKQALAITTDRLLHVTLAPDQGHGRLFIDLPESAATLQVQITAPDDIATAIVRETPRFEAPQIALVAGTAGALDTITGSGTVTLAVAAGRYYVVPVNGGTVEATAQIEVSVQHAASTVVPVQGLWFNPQRDGAGFNLNLTDNQLIIEWYTYLEDGTPVWYLAQGAFPLAGDVWQADLNYFSWNGTEAQATVVGAVRLILQSPTELIFDYQVNGISGSETYVPIIGDLSCAANGAIVERTGLWFVPALPGFGYSILSVAGQQVHINYLYGPTGLPRWVLGQADDGASSVPMAQFSGFCPSCATVATNSVAAGTNEISYTDAQQGSVSTSIQFAGPLAGQWLQSGDIVNLTPQPACP